MKVAVAGTGPVAQYLIEEIGAYGHQIIVLTRSIKPDEKAIEQRQTDYSIPSLVEVLEDCDALVSTVADYTNIPAAMNVHLNMLEAIKQSKRCKTFIPSEWTSNVEDYPEQPMFFAEHNKTLHKRLKEETGFRWTIISTSWLADYVVSQKNRHLRDIPGIWPMDYANKVFTIPGPGTQVVSLVFMRDVARAVSVLLDSKEPWKQYTYLSSQQLTWNELFAIIQKHDPQWTSQTKPLADTVNQVVAKESAESVLLGQFELLSYSGASALPREKVQRDRAKYFGQVRFRTVEEILAEAANQPNNII